MLRRTLVLLVRYSALWKWWLVLHSHLLANTGIEFVLSPEKVQRLNTSKTIHIQILIINPVTIANPMLINVPMTRYSVFISCLSFSLNRIIPFAAISRPIAEY